jgi:tRNA (cmo5U34)-methyltransferase
MEKVNTDEVVQIFENMGAEVYDQFNSHFRQLSESLFLLTMLALRDLPNDANILCVGVGTGADIIDIAKFKSGWTFTGIEPSTAMLSGCKQKLAEAGLTERCELFNGYLSDFNTEKKFDGVVCYFVMHFIDPDERKNIFTDMNKHLKNGGSLVHAEISCDLEASDFPYYLEDWKALHGFAGATEEKLAMMSQVLKEQLYVLSPKQTKTLVEGCGFTNHIQFFQSFLIHGWHGKKIDS